MTAKVVFGVEYGFYKDYLDFILQNGIYLASVKLTEYGFTAECYSADYKKIAHYSRRFQCRIRIIKKKGLYFAFYRFRKRKGIGVAVCLFPLMYFFLSCIIWKTDINTDDPDIKNTIGYSLYNLGISPGSICTKTKLSDAQRQLMLENSAVGYVTLNFYRGILECNVYIRNEKKDNKREYTMNDIVCYLDGIVTDIRVYSGFSDIKPGQSVGRGDILVYSSRTDSRGRLDVQSTAAYIAGDCEKKYTVYIPYDKNAVVYTGLIKKDVTLNFLGKSFSVVKNDITDFGKYTTSTVISPLEVFGFSFPATVKTDIYAQLGEMEIESSFPDARKTGKNQLNHIIKNDVKLEKEYSREYDYILSEEGITVNCRVKGRYIMT